MNPVLEAFIDLAEARRGKKIAETDGDDRVSAARRILEIVAPGE